MKRSPALHTLLRRSLLPPVQLASLATAALLALACASSSAPPVTVADVTFAPVLEVDTTRMTPLRGGLWYRDLQTGTGREARRGDTVAVYYAGYFADGTLFDSTDPPAAPVRIRLGAGQVIGGWERGIVGMRAGGRRQLVVPPALGYGRGGTERIPPNSVLVFTIDLVEVR